MEKFRSNDSSVTSEATFEFVPTLGVYKLAGTPKPYQALLETLAVLFPRLEIIVGIPVEFGRVQEFGLLDPKTEKGITCVLYDRRPGHEPFDLAESPYEFSRLIERLRAFEEK